METANAAPDYTCKWCGAIHLTQKCPLVKAIDYWPNGTMKRVEFFPQGNLLGCGPQTGTATT